MRNTVELMPPLNNPTLHLQVLSEYFFIAKLHPGIDIPPCVLRVLTDLDARGFFSVTKTKEEISLVGKAHEWMPDSLKLSSQWRCIKVVGPIEHGECLI
jgi:hypothetical protein